MNPTLIAHAPTVAFVASVNLSASSVEASDCASTRPKARVAAGAFFEWPVPAMSSK